MKTSILRPVIVASAALVLGACSSYGDNRYGYSGASLGYGSRYNSTPYYGWYDDYYYPGIGYYIYDRSGSRQRWSDRHRNYWEARRPSRGYRENWSGYRGDRDGWDRNRGRGDDRGDRRRGRDRDDDRRGRGRGRDD